MITKFPRPHLESAFHKCKLRQTLIPRSKFLSGGSRSYPQGELGLQVPGVSGGLGRSRFKKQRFVDLIKYVTDELGGPLCADILITGRADVSKRVVTGIVPC
jgi:hypothetical protein